MIDYIENVDLTMYFADALTPTESLSQSTAQVMLQKSPHHAWAQHPRFGGHPRKVSVSMKLGSIIDELLTNEGRRLQLVPFKDYKTNDAKAARDAVIAAGRIPVKQAEMVDMQEMADRARKNLMFHGVDLEPAKKQVCILWDETASNGNKVQCKALLDYLYPGGLIRDLKATESCAPGRQLDAKAIRFGYPIQAAAYMHAVEAVFPDLAGRARFQNIWIEDEWPYEVLISEFGGEALQYGQVMWQRAIDLWEECTRTNRWPGYQERAAPPYRVALPSWATEEMFNLLDEGAEHMGAVEFPGGEARDGHLPE